MRHKVGPKDLKTDTVIDPAVLKSAREDIFRPTPPKTFSCKVCGEAGATEQSDCLCWVCRRLKISAWHEIEQQTPLSE